MIPRFRRVPWFCAGVDFSLAQFVKTEHVALTAVGATVLLTAVLAFVSGSYALYVVSGSGGAAIAFGFLWAAFIFNLDRFIVSSIRKQGHLQAEILIAAPRAVMALIISIVIIVPVELWLFRAEIEAKLSENALEQQRAYVKAAEQQLQSLIDQVEMRITQIQNELKELETQREKIYREGEGTQLRATIKDLENQRNSAISRKAELERHAIEEFEGLGPSGQKGAGPQYRVLMARVMEEESAIRQLNDQLQSAGTDLENAKKRLDGLINEPRIMSLRSELETQEKTKEDLLKQKRALLDPTSLNTKAIQPASLLTRLTIVHKLAEENATADWSITLLRLLIILLELSPILIKLMCPRGPYDALRDAAEREEVLGADLRKLKAEIEYQNQANKIRKWQCVTPTES
jgi:Domain of unknown function (DUF4407)